MDREKDCEARMEQHDTMWEVIFGDPTRGEKGMKQKVDEIHEILIQAKGLKGVLYILIAIGGALAVIKGIFIR